MAISRMMIIWMMEEDWVWNLQEKRIRTLVGVNPRRASHFEPFVKPFADKWRCHSHHGRLSPYRKAITSYHIFISPCHHIIECPSLHIINFHITYPGVMPSLLIKDDAFLDALASLRPILEIH